MGAPNIREVGGGPATGLAESLIQFLQGGLTLGSFGGGTAGGQANLANPTANTTGIAGVLNDILAGGGGNVGGALGQLVTRQADRDVGALRERFTQGGGASFGTPAAYGEALLRSETAPKLVSTIGNMQLQALMPILQMMTGLAGKGISQRETIASPSTLSQIGSIAAPIVGAAAAGPLSGLFSNGMPALPAAPPMFPGLNLPNVAPVNNWSFQMPALPGSY